VGKDGRVHELTDAQRELARIHQVSTEFEDWQGRPRVVDPATVLAVLTALGVEVGDPEAAERSLAQHREAQRREILPPCVVVRQGRQVDVPLRHESASAAQAWIELEAGTTVDVTIAPAPVGAVVPVPVGLPPGYHSLRVRSSAGDASSELIVTPPFLGFPEAMKGDRDWGFAVQLYSVRSRESWGVGDLADLRQLVAWSGADLGAGYLLLNPLSASEPVAPMEPSPYLPSSRRFVNPLYIRVEDIPEYDNLPPADRAEVEALRFDVHVKLDDADTIDRDTAWAAKSQALRRVHAAPRNDKRERAFREFLEREGDPLRDFATWCVLTEEHGADWHEWPTVLRHPNTQQVKDFRAAHPADVEFHSWLQWVLDDQLEAAQGEALAAGMSLGVMHDLAVGVHPRGADAWTRQDALALGVTVGAPPDAFNQMGQDWSQPPWRPDRLAELAYAPFRELISRLLRHAGGIRVDHIIGLFRLWWIPEGMTPDRGTYVRYDHEALIGILALEGQRAGAVVVGEDLGNVEPAAREYLRERGIVGTSILWFERDADQRPLPADRWREYSLASVTTHDLPPTAGYLAGDHVALRESLGLLTRSVAEERATDETEREAWLDKLRADGLLADDADTEDTVLALYEFVSRTPARLVGVALTDAVGDRRTQNQPGTIDEYPNWRVPLTGPDGVPLDLEDVVASKRARRLAAAVRAGLRSAQM
jgi:4-alpha-glucanotransferase